MVQMFNNKKGIIQWLMILIVALIGIPILAGVLTPSTTLIWHEYLGETLAVNNNTYTNLIHNELVEQNAVCYMGVVAKGVTLLSSPANYTSSSSGCALRSTTNTTNGNWTIDYQVEYEPQGYITDGITRLIVPFILAIFCLGILTLVWGLVGKQD